jgi:predicted nucleotidyltransferase
MHATPDRPFAADEILNTLTDHGVDFVVIGGIAVQVHGCIRGTHDVDIVARPSALNMSRLAEALADLEAEHRLPGSLNLDDAHALLRAPLIAVVTRAGPLDIVNIEHLAGQPRDYQALRDHALGVELQGRQLAVAGLSDVIRMKRAAGREQDLADIEALTRRPKST